MHLFVSKVKKKNISYKEVYNDPSLFKEYVSASISATSISEVTEIPRATCVRKLETLTNMNIISKDKISKRYYVILGAITDDLISQKATKKRLQFLANFFYLFKVTKY
jgi:predicted transcriptional regulator